MRHIVRALAVVGFFVVVFPLGVCRAGDQDARLEYAGRKQNPGQSDFDFAKSCIVQKSNSLPVDDPRWEREQDRINAQYKMDLYRVFEFIAGKRGDRLQEYDLKIDYQEEVQDHWKRYVEEMTVLWDRYKNSKSLVEMAFAAEYQRATDKGKIQLQAAMREMAELKAGRRKKENNRIETNIPPGEAPVHQDKPAAPKKAAPPELPNSKPALGGVPAPAGTRDTNESPTKEEVKIARFVALLKDENAVVRKRAAIALGQIGPEAEKAVLALEKALSDNDAQVRDAVATALERIDQPKTLQSLTGIVNDKNQDPEKRSSACEELAKRFPKEEAARTTLEEAVADAHPKVRAAAAAALETIDEVLRGTNTEGKKTASALNLKQIGLAMRIYHIMNRFFPPAAVYSQTFPGGEAKRLLSWRVAILPYVSEGELYKQFKLDEPWDSEHNKRLLAKMPKVYAPPGMETKEPYTTFYQVFVGRDTVFGDLPWSTTRLDDLEDTSNTLLVVEAFEPVPWTKPEELAYDGAKPLPKLGGLFKDGFNAAGVDGSIRFLKTGTYEPLLRRMIIRKFKPSSETKPEG
jgi:hypothetical protein